MAGKSEKLNLGALRAKSEEIANNPEAQAFVKAAATPPEKPKPQPKPAHKLMVIGHLQNRSERCRAPIQLHLLRESADWIDQNTLAGRGGVQASINYLIRRGIQAVEEEYQAKGQMIVDELE
jgi:hypothetical protein